MLPVERHVAHFPHRKERIMFVIPVADLNSQSIEATLDSILFYLILDWNDTGKYWSMGIRNASYTSLIDGISVSPNYGLTWQFRYADMPAGELTVGSSKKRSGPIPRDGFMTGEYQLIYQTYADLVELGIDMTYYVETSPIVI